MCFSLYFLVLSCIKSLPNLFWLSALKKVRCFFCFVLFLKLLFFFFYMNGWILFIYLFLAVLGLRFCAGAFSSCGKRGGHSSSCCVGLSLSRPLLLRSIGSRRAGSVVVAHGPSCSAACGILPDQGSNPCPLHWQADSQPLRHQGSPSEVFFRPASCLKFIVERDQDYAPYDPESLTCDLFSL